MKDNFKDFKPILTWLEDSQCLYFCTNLIIKTLQVRGQSQEVKGSIKRVKSEIEKQLEKRLSILVNKPEQSYGNTNDGNTSRKFFNNVEVVSEITGITLASFISIFRIDHDFFQRVWLGSTSKVQNHFNRDKLWIRSQSGGI